MNPRFGVGGAGVRHLLMLCTSCPFPPTNGYTMRLWALVNCLYAEGCEVDVICFGSAASECDLSQLRRVCRHIDLVEHCDISLSRGLNLQRRMAALLSGSPYGVNRSKSDAMAARIVSRLKGVDAILCEETNLLQNLPSPLPVPLIVDHHNAEYLLLERYARHERNPFKAIYAYLESRAMRRWETRANTMASLALVCSDHDRSIFLTLNSGLPVITAPNVIDMGAYSPSFHDDGRTILYTGGMDWHPNRDAVQFFADHIFPEIRHRVPGTRFLVAGRGPSKEFRARFSNLADVVFTGTVPDLREEIAKAAVCIVPLRMGSGTRLKILEAAAMGKAIVSTPLGSEGLSFQNGVDILVEQHPLKFAAATIAVLSDIALRRRLGQAARSRMERDYGYPVLRASMREALRLLPGAVKTAAGRTCVH